MKSIMFIPVIVILVLACTSCERAGKDQIVYNTVNKELILIRDTKALMESDDEFSVHIDSIISGLINAEFISTGLRSFDLLDDENPDISFEIIDLNKYNPNGLPEYFDSLAARVHPMAVEVLDNSTYGYPDALNQDELIDEKGRWTNRICVLGTFMNAGQFQGRGEKCLGFRFPKDGDYHYGWIKIFCSEHNDTLRIIDYAYNQNRNNSIKAGQKK